MQSRFCSRALPPSLAATALRRRPIWHWPPAWRLLRTDEGPKPAASFAALIDQLDALVKQPNPPRNYGDALAKEELRNVDYRDLTVDPSDKVTEQGARRLLRQRPRLVRHGQHLVSDTVASQYAEVGRARAAVVDKALKEAGLPKPDTEAGEPLAKDIALDLGISAEQRNRRRLWMARIAGYREFRTSLLSMDKLLNALKNGLDDVEPAATDGASDAPAASESATRPETAAKVAVEDPVSKVAVEDPEAKAEAEAAAKAAAEAAAEEEAEDARFEELLRQSWRIVDEDLAEPPATEQEESSVQPPPRTSTPGSQRPGTRSFHTVRQLSRVASSGPPDKGPPPKPSSKKARIQAQLSRMIKSSPSAPPKPAPKSARWAGDKPASFLRQADMPTHEELEKHVSESKDKDGQMHIPIVVHASVGDIVDSHAIAANTFMAPFGTDLEPSAIFQRTTGRFQYSIVTSSGLIIGSRTKDFGFVAPGLMFDKEFLRKGGVSKEDTKTILAFGKAAYASAQPGGAGMLTNAAAVERLQLVHNQRMVQTKIPTMLDNTHGDDLDAVLAGVGGEESSSDYDALGSADAASEGITGQDLGVESGTTDAGVPEVDIEGMDELMCILRVLPRALRILRDNAERLLRSHYREMNGYWAMATDQGQTTVTVDALAELIFGLNGSKYERETARLAAYTHLSGSPEYFVPSEEALFYSQTFELRPRADVEEIQRAHNMIRRNAPEFRQFIDKARGLVAAAYARNTATPLRTGLSPTVESANDTFKCDLTGWAITVDFDNAPRKDSKSVDIVKAGPGAAFDETDQLFIRMLCRYIDQTNFGYTYARNPYMALVAPIIKKIGPYTESDISTVARFLIDIGVYPHWYNSRLNFRSQPFKPEATSDMGPVRMAAESCAQRYLAGDPGVVDGGAESISASASCPAGPSVPWKPDPATRVSALTQSSSGAGVIGRTEFYGRDICEDIRHDFGGLLVYTIDDAATRDVDDGFSLETVKGADGVDQKWVHIHVADPTALIHPGHVVADGAFERMSTLYLRERTTHMLPFDLTVKEISLSRRADGGPARTMTFSARIGDDGDIAEYKVRAGLVRNVMAVPYELADRYLSYAHTIEPINSLDKLQDSLRHDTLVHPFGTPPDTESRRYGENCGELSEPVAQQLLELQAIIQRHAGLRIRCGSFSRMATAPDMSVDMGGEQKAVRDSSYLVYPRITAANSLSFFSPAHLLVAEAMGLAGRVATRFASEHAAPGGYGQGINSAGVATEWTTIPLLFRSQEDPDLPMLRGCSPNMQLAFDGMSAEDAQSAEKVWQTFAGIARANGGYVELKHHDEVRTMMNPSVFMEIPSVHCGLGLHDKYGYARVTSPIRRLDDLVNHWQLKAQLLAEHGNAQDKQPWFWRHEDMRRLVPVVFRKQFAAAKAMRQSELYWSIAMVQRMEYEARRGILQRPPPGFYTPDSPNYQDNPFAYYDPSRPGPLVWTAVADNREDTRLFTTVILEGCGAHGMLLPRPLDPMLLPFAGTKVRVQVVTADPVRALLYLKLAPLEFQPAETQPFWSTRFARNVTPENVAATNIPPG